jgi:hypothetical protein
VEYLKVLDNGNNMKHIKTGDCFAILITSDKYKKLLAVQVFPQTKALAKAGA